MSGEVLLGYNGHSSARAALHTAVQVAQAFQRPLIIVFGYAPSAMGGETADLSRAVEEIGDEITGEAIALVRELAPELETRVELVNDRPADAILRAAEAFEPLTVVIGSAGRGPLSGGLLGSVTYQVVHRAAVPVLVVPLPDPDAE